MANQNAIQDDNQFPALIGHSGTAGTAETRRIVVSSSGGITADVTAPGDLITSNYDYILRGTPSGTTEVYTFKTGGSSGSVVGTVTINYTGSGYSNIYDVTAVNV